MSSDAKHDYHLVDPSPWPLVGSVFAFIMMVGAVFWMKKGYEGFGVMAGTPWFFLISQCVVNAVRRSSIRKIGVSCIPSLIAQIVARAFPSLKRCPTIAAARR